MSLSRNTLNFGVGGFNITSPQSITLSLTNSGASWSATSSRSDIVVSPAFGTGSGSIQISVTDAAANGTVTISAAGVLNSPQQVQVHTISVTPGIPFGSFDTPINNTSGIAGAVPVTGWALDTIEVSGVDILREPIAGEPAGNLILIGSAVFVADARPDVQGLYPNTPFNYRAGWGYQLLTNFLPNAAGSGAPGNGVYRLHAIARNKLGTGVDLGTKTIFVDNAHASKPFGTLDTPGQGGTISGSGAINFGWVLTQQPFMIPTDGSTITVVIDGQPQGHPTYNQFRSDVAALFPNYANSGGAVGFYRIDTTKFTNGVHTISWNVFDNGGRGDGIGSRYFNVFNSGASGAAAPEEPHESMSSQSAKLRRALDVNAEPEALKPAANGGYSIEMEELDRIELQVGVSGGYLLANGEHLPLPIGSSFKDGAFYWQPGPGFLGDYDLVLTAQIGEPVPVRIRITPKKFGPVLIN
jgi:hypothetical protein